MKFRFLGLLVLAILQPMFVSAMQLTPQESYMLFINDAKRRIRDFIDSSSSLEEAIKKIVSIRRSDQYFDRILNDKSIIDYLITELAHRFEDDNRVYVGWQLDTPQAYGWFSTPEARAWFKKYIENEANKDAVVHNFLYFLYDSRKSAASLQKFTSLLEIGINPNVAINAEGDTPLSYAIKNNDVALLKLLLSYGADPNWGQSAVSPLEQAVNGKKVEMMRMLLEAGANPNSKTSLGKTLLEHLRWRQARGCGGPEDTVIEEMLRKYQSSLSCQSLRAVARLIKQGHLTLEQTREILPLEVYEQLENIVRPR